MEQLAQVLKSLNLDKIEHNAGKSLLTHCENVRSILKDFDASAELQLAGLCHSIYGRQITKFNPIPFSDRKNIQNIIGDRAEHLCFLNCIMLIKSFWENLNFIHTNFNYQIINRLNGDLIPVSRADIYDLLNLNYANMVEHVDKNLSIEKFKWIEMSLYSQNFEYLLPKAKEHFILNFVGKNAN